MARTIDWSKELSDEDRAWAEQRLDAPSGTDGLTIGEQITKNDEQFGRVAKVAKQSRAERMADLRTVIADATNELARLEQEQIDEDNANVALAGSLGTGNVIRDNTPVNGERPEGAPEPADDYDDEKKWTKAALVAEIEKRNDDGAQLAKTGNRSELVERLREDDRELREQAGN